MLYTLVASATHYKLPFDNCSGCTCHTIVDPPVFHADQCRGLRALYILFCQFASFLTLIVVVVLRFAS
jgi:hypothetical protein